MIGVLLPGNEPKERVELLLSLTKISSENLQSAITDHLSNGVQLADAAVLNDCEKSNLKRAMVKVEQVASTVEQIKEIDWYKKSVK